MPNSHSAVVRPSSTRRRDQFEYREVQAPRQGLGKDRMSEAAASVVDVLESRQMMSVTVDSAGWTQVTPEGGDRVIYVSSTTGSDSNSGLNPSSPVRSIGRGKSLVRGGTGDQLLLKRGDNWNEAFGFWSVSGASANRPIVIGAYGSGARPALHTGRNYGLQTSLGGVSNLAIIGVHFDAKGRGGATPDGIASTGKNANILIEDCEFLNYRNNLTFQAFFGSISNLKVRRNVIADAYSNSSHSQGIYADGVHGVLLEENIFDHNGWGNGAGSTAFNHNAYITAKSSGLVAKGNVFANASSHGLQARPGGTVQDNLFYNNGIGLSFGLVNGGGTVVAGGVTGVVTGNVFSGGHRVAGNTAGVGLELGNIKAATVADNVFAYGDPSERNAAINLSKPKGPTNAYQAVGVNNLSVVDNVVYRWSQGLQVSGDAGVRNLTLRNNDFQQITSYQAVVVNGAPSGDWSQNTFNVPSNKQTPVLLGARSLRASGLVNTAVSYPDPSRSLGKYDGNFLTKARQLSSANWDSRYLARAVTAWIAAGFGVNTGAAVPVTVPVVTPPTNVVGSPTSTGVNADSPNVSIGDASVTEPDVGTKSMVFTVRLSKTSSAPVIVKWQTKGQTATPGSDYIGRNGTITFAPGQTTKTISVVIRGDYAKEANETLQLQLLSAVAAKIATPFSTGTIINDD